MDTKTIALVLWGVLKLCTLFLDHGTYAKSFSLGLYGNDID
jgi:hypothetical protein